MIKNIKQTDKGLLPEIQKYGCLFLCFAHASPLVFAGAEGVESLNALYRYSVRKGFISGDLNKDGDVDDAGEAEVMSHNGLCHLFLMECTYDEKHHLPNEKIPANVKHLFGCYRWKGTHFVVVDRTKRVLFDPMGSSATVANGKLETLRWYYSE